MGWPDLEGGVRGCRDTEVCREVIRMAGHRGIHQRWGLGGCREVIPGTEQSTLPLTRRFPWRVAKSHLRKDDMMALGRPMEAAGRCSVGRLQNCTTVRILSTRRDKNSDQCGSDEEQEPIHPKNPLRIAVLFAAGR